MKGYTSLISFLCLAISLAACGPSPAEMADSHAPAAIVASATQTAKTLITTSMPTSTPVPTDPPQPSNTPTAVPLSSRLIGDWEGVGDSQGIGIAFEDGHIYIRDGFYFFSGLYTVDFSPEPAHLDFQTERLGEISQIIEFVDENTIRIEGGQERPLTFSTEAILLKRVTASDEQLLKIHSGFISNLVFSPKGEILASHSVGEEVKIWNVETGLEVNTLKSHNNEMVTSILFSPEGNILAIGSFSDTEPKVGLWDLESEQWANTFRGGPLDDTRSIAFSPDGSLLTTMKDASLLVYDVDSGQVVKEWDLKASINTLYDYWDRWAFSPNGDFFVFGKEDTVQVWSIESGQKINTFRGFDGDIVSVDISPNGKIVASGATASEYPVRLWDVSSGMEIQRFVSQFEVGIVAFSPDGTLLAVGYSDYPEVELYDVTTGQIVLRLKGHTFGLDSIAFSPDGKTIATSGGDATIRLWDISDIPVDVPLPTSIPTATITPQPDANAIADAGLIAFASDRDGVLGIYVMNADGTGDADLLTIHPYNETMPAWSPSGEQIAYVSARDLDIDSPIDPIDIYVINADGSELTRLTDDPQNFVPSWSQDNQQLVFASNRDGNSEIYVMKADGSGVTRLTNNPALDGNPSWSPDGGQIAFESDRDGDAEIFAMNADGSNVIQLTENTASDSGTAWSPDGERIAFASDRDGNAEIYVMNTDGSDVTRLSNDPAYDLYPAWSPDGQMIAFTSTRDGNAEIYVMNADGSGVRRLTNNPAEDSYPSWSPRGEVLSDDPWFGPPWCSRDTDGDMQPDTPSSTFTTEDMFAYIVFPFHNMEDGIAWSHDWITESSGSMSNVGWWDSGESGFHVAMFSAPSFGSGPLTIQLYIEDEMVQEVICEIVEP